MTQVKQTDLVYNQTHQLTEASGSQAASDARVAANQNLLGAAVVGQIVFVGVSQRLENMGVFVVTGCVFIHPGSSPPGPTFCLILYMFFDRMSCIFLTSPARNFLLGRDASFLSSLR